MQNLLNWYFGTTRREIINSIDFVVKGKSHIGSAILLSSYTEIMGGYVTGNLLKQNKMSKNYSAFLKYLGDEYVDVSKTLSKTKWGLYHRVRNGLVHQGRMHGQWHIILRDKISNSIGLSYNQNLDLVTLNVKEYHRDFKRGIKKWENELIEGGEKSTLFIKFLQCFIEESHTEYKELKKLRSRNG